MTTDDEQLKLLSTFHYVAGGLTAILSCFGFIHLAFGIAIVSGALPMARNDPGMPQVMGWFFIAIATLFIAVGWSYAIAMVMAGQRLRRRRAYVFCMVMAGLSCMQVPIGTCLGVFTIVILSRPSVKALFQGQKAEASRSELY